MASFKPSVARIVHYVEIDNGAEVPALVCRAALMTEVRVQGTTTDVGLCVTRPSEQQFYAIDDDGGVPYDAGQPANPATGMCGGMSYANDSWHWPLT